MPKGRPAPDNSAAGKRRLEYDGHDQRPGVAAANDTVHWRKIRRSVKRWLTARMESW